MLLAILAAVGEIGASVLQALGLLGTVVTLLNFIKGEIVDIAREHHPFGIEGMAAGIIGALDDTVYGLAAINAKLTTAMTQLDYIHDNIPALGSPVTLPTSPPTGYGGLGTDDVGVAVWHFPGLPDALDPGQLLQEAARYAINRVIVDADLTCGRWFAPVYAALTAPLDSTTEQPIFIPGDVLPGETLLDTITRQNPTATCSWWEGEGGHVYVQLATTMALQRWVTRFDAYEFVHLYSVPAVTVPLLLAPVWPGLALVTLGSPVDLSTGVAIDGPLDGVIVSITGVPPRASAYDFAGTLSYVRLGALTFLSDNGQAEYPQNLGFTSETYSPKTMLQAAGVRVRTIGGVSGTVTPWTKLA